MKLVAITFAFMINFYVLANCSNINLYDQIVGYKQVLKSKNQSYGTCYAEANAYRYNFLHQNSLNFVHPWYLIVLNSVDNEGAEGGTALLYNEEYLPNQKICPYEKVQNLINEYKMVIHELFEIDINEKNAEQDILALLQAMLIYNNNSYKDLSIEDLLKIHAMSTQFYIDDLNQLQPLAQVVEMKVDNTKVITNILPKKVLGLDIMSQKQVALLDFMKLYYKNLKLNYFGEKKHFNIFSQKIISSIDNNKNHDFRSILSSLLNKTCEDNEKISINKDQIKGDVKFVKNWPDFSQDISVNLQVHQPTLLSIFAITVSPKLLPGFHAVVAMGMRQNHDSCDLLIRNSWDEIYANSTGDCHCYNHEQKKYQNCTLNEAQKSTNLEALACWYSGKETVFPGTLFYFDQK